MRSQNPPDALLLLHGFLGSPEGWSTVLEDIKVRDAKVLIPTLLGHGPDPQTQNIHAFKDEVHRIASLVSKHGLKSIHVCGYSMGARVVLGLLVLHPELVHSATLIAPYPGIEDLKTRQARSELEQQWIEKLQSTSIEEFVAYWETLPIFEGQQERISIRAWENQRKIRVTHEKEGIIQAIHVLGTSNMPNWNPNLRQIDKPVTLIAGEFDEKFVRLTKEMNKEMRNSQLRYLKGGHNVLLEHPRELTQYLSKVFC